MSNSAINRGELRPSVSKPDIFTECEPTVGIARERRIAAAGIADTEDESFALMSYPHLHYAGGAARRDAVHNGIFDKRLENQSGHHCVGEAGLADLTDLKPAEEIDWIESANNYVVLHAGRAAHVLRETLTELATRLEPRHFLRISRSAAVNPAR